MAFRFLRHAAFVAGIAASCAIFSNATLAAGPVSGSYRPLPTAGLTQYNVGGGATVYTNTPSGVVGFSWNTGSSTGSISGLPSGSVSSTTIGK
jgi:hypothetical protein